jgi:hypothetical protein
MLLPNVPAPPPSHGWQGMRERGSGPTVQDLRFQPMLWLSFDKIKTILAFQHTFMPAPLIQRVSRMTSGIFAPANGIQSSKEPRII